MILMIVDKTLNEEKPEMLKDIYFNPLFIDRDGEGYYVVGSCTSDSYLLVPPNRVPLYMKFVEFFDGTHSIREACSMGFGNSEDIEKIMEMFRNYGFLKGSKKFSSFNEVKNFSVNLCSWQKTSWSEYMIKFAKQVSKFSYKDILILLTIFSFIILITSYDNLINNKYGFDTIFQNLLSFKNYFYINIAMIPMFILHEFGHVIKSISYELGGIRVTFSLFWYLIPMVYIEHKNLYFLERKKILAVILAGIVTNVLLCLICLILYIILRWQIFLIMACANFRIVYLNILPITLSDGYFAFGVISSTPNIRLNMYRTVANPKYIFKLKNKEKFFVIISILSTLIILKIESLWILNIFRIGNNLSLRVILTIILILMFVTKSRKVIKSI